MVAHTQRMLSGTTGQHYTNTSAINKRLKFKYVEAND